MSSPKSSGILRGFSLFAAAGFLALWLIRCAGQIPPGGGPADRQAPFIVFTDPDTNAVRVETDRIVLEFSEYVDRRSAEQSIFISPWPGQVEYEWSGTELTVLLPEALRENRTYVVSIGTDVIDRRERNRMASGFALAFSTGESIDEGYISGRVYDDKPEGVMVFAYLLDALNPDTLNPGTLRPDYVTQTGRNGTFTLAHVAFGSYRVVAVRDEFRDLLYGRQIDQYGVPTRDVVVAGEAPQAGDIRFRLSAEDTSRPFLTAVLPISPRMLLARFSEAIDSLAVRTANFTLTDTVTGIPLLLHSPYLVRGTPSLLMISPAGALDSGSAYRFRASGLSDRTGNRLDTANAEGVFVAGGARDTTPPMAGLFGAKDTLHGFAPDKPLLISCSEPVDTTAAVSGIRVADSSGAPAEYDPFWLGPAELALIFRQPLEGGAWYDVTIRLDSLRDMSGNALRDSLRVVRVQTIDPKTRGTIEGSVTDAGEGGGAIVLTAVMVGAGGEVAQEITLAGPGPFVMKDLPEGFYSLQAFRDADGSGTYSYGLPFPFTPSERFTVLPDTLKVRARWGVEDVKLELR